ncbi:MAG: tetratricopeptide repeat protein [Streptosporangiaceae bacterium]
MTEDDLDDLEDDTLRTGEHAVAAERLADLARTVPAGNQGVSRAKILLRAGEQFQHAGDPARAAELYRLAIEDGGEVYGDPRVYLADALFELGDRDEAVSLLADIRDDKPTDPEVYRVVAEVLYEQGDLLGAHQWSTAGADLVLAQPEGTRGDAAESLEGLLRLRFRARVDLGRPEDDYDALLDA